LEGVNGHAAPNGNGDALCGKLNGAAR
jgi:hypothetical protein